MLTESLFLIYNRNFLNTIYIIFNGQIFMISDFDNLVLILKQTN